MLPEQTDRRQFLMLTAAGVFVAGTRRTLLGAESTQVSPQREGDLAWYDVGQWGVEGRGWSHTERYFDRLPAKAKGVVRDAVWNLSRHSAGMCVRFRTNATSIRARYELLSPGLAMSHMPATGVSGLDLYAQDDQQRWRWLAVVRPSAQTVRAEIISGIAPGTRAYTIYLPLYNGVQTLEIGVPAGAEFEPIAPRSTKPLVYYGTSIAHGACASRPGMAFPSILGRRLDVPVLNLGFSGNGRMEAEVGALLAELAPCVYCIDCLPNMQGPEVAARTEPLVRQLRRARPETPIVLIEDRTYTNTPFLPSRRERHRASRAALKAAYEKLIADGVQQLSYVAGEDLLGDDGEAATDGSHPSDLGMMRMADALEPVLRPLVGGS